MNSLIHRPKQQRSFKEIAVYIFTILILVSGILFYIWPRVRIVRMGYEFERAENIHKGLIQNNRKLRLEIESLKSLSHIERIARDKLGMTFPNDDQIAIIKEETLMLTKR